jgi:hypothetical protein
MNRNEFLKRSAGSALVTVPLMGGLASPALGSAQVTASLLTDAGVGTYTDPSVANQISNFTINRCMISCGVGTITDGRFSGPFAMLMFATSISSYVVSRGHANIRAVGRMRSITRIAGATVEDVEHDFLAIAVDKRGAGPDRFDVHFTTPFWSPGNPFCTPSTVRPGWCRFGGALILDPNGNQMGDVSVAP